jgi:hypothetical protein
MRSLHLIQVDYIVSLQLTAYRLCTPPRHRRRPAGAARGRGQFIVVAGNWNGISYGDQGPARTRLVGRPRARPSRARVRAAVSHNDATFWRVCGATWPSGYGSAARVGIGTPAKPASPMSVRLWRPRSAAGSCAASQFAPPFRSQHHFAGQLQDQLPALTG